MHDPPEGLVEESPAVGIALLRPPGARGPRTPSARGWRAARRRPAPRTPARSNSEGCSTSRQATWSGGTPSRSNARAADCQSSKRGPISICLTSPRRAGSRRGDEEHRSEAAVEPYDVVMVRVCHYSLMASRMSRLVGVISDTHGLVRPAALTALAGSQLIVHAGDVGSPEVLDQLRGIAPVVAVRGNNDRGAWAECLSATEVVDLDGVFLYVLHDVKELDLDPRAAGFRAVIAGHSHRPGMEERDGVLFLNPGSAGPRRFTLPITAGPPDRPRGRPRRGDRPPRGGRGIAMRRWDVVTFDCYGTLIDWERGIAGAFRAALVRRRRRPRSRARARRLPRAGARRAGRALSPLPGRADRDRAARGRAPGLGAPGGAGELPGRQPAELDALRRHQRRARATRPRRLSPGHPLQRRRRSPGRHPPPLHRRPSIRR